jgi:hypothetical protein
LRITSKIILNKNDLINKNKKQGKKISLDMTPSIFSRGYTAKRFQPKAKL